MRHLIVSREFPPASYPPGGIGTYTANVARLLAEAGEVVHVIGERWAGAPEERETRCNGRLVVHRVAVGDSAHSALPNDAERFAWRAGLLAEQLAMTEGIDVIEAQEWEAPLAFFLARRARGLGPERRPPVIVHLHSPTSAILTHNEWPLDGRSTTVRYEAACVAAADALLAPSRFIARDAAALFGRDADDIRVIPYPVGDSGVIHRAESVWRAQRIAYVGRFEPRKGVIEFVEAAVEAAGSFPDSRFELIGDDVAYRNGQSVREYVESRIPREARHRFRFSRPGSRARVREIFARARAAVVPSRWDNFPYAAIEAMASGLPVISSPNGGMVEVITDGVSGWIAAGSSSTSLASALARALAASAEQCAAMGREAMASIERACSNAGITRRQIEFRAEIAARGAKRSLLPAVGAWSGIADLVAPGTASVLPGPEASARKETAADVPRLTLRQSLELPLALKFRLMKAAARRPRRAARWLRSRVEAIVSERLRKNGTRR